MTYTPSEEDVLALAKMLAMPNSAHKDQGLDANWVSVGGSKDWYLNQARYILAAMGERWAEMEDKARGGSASVKADITYEFGGE